MSTLPNLSKLKQKLGNKLTEEEEESPTSDETSPFYIKTENGIKTEIEDLPESHFLNAKENGDEDDTAENEDEVKNKNTALKLCAVSF